MYFHGTEDRVCPYEGSGSPWFDPPAEDLAKRWAKHNKCSGEWVEEIVSAEVVRYTWAECEAETEFYKIVGGGHQWPGTSWPATQDISASLALWDFFGLHGRS
jgi:polyhydroxybutyrate depolymerase